MSRRNQILFWSGLEVEAGSGNSRNVTGAVREIDENGIAKIVIRNIPLCLYYAGGIFVWCLRDRQQRPASQKQRDEYPTAVLHASDSRIPPNLSYQFNVAVLLNQSRDVFSVEVFQRPLLDLFLFF